MSRARTWLVLAACAAGLARAQAPPRFGVSVELVYVDAFVTHKGEPFLGLTERDFELKDDGVPQTLELVAADSLPLLAVLAFDTSGSLAGDKLAALRSASDAFLAGLRPSDEVGLLTFSEELAWRAGPTRDRQVVRDALGRLQARGATALFDALYACLVLPETQARTLVVLFSDGQDNMSFLDAARVRAVVERSNALVHVVGTRPPAPVTPALMRGAPSPARAEPEHVRVLRRVAELTGGRYWEAESGDKLTAAFAAIALAMNHRYVLRYEPRGEPHPGWHRLSVRLRGRSGDVQARSGYWVGAP